MLPSLSPTVTKKQQGHVVENLFVETDGGVNRVQPNGRLPNSLPQKLPDPVPPIQKSNQNGLEIYQTAEEKAAFLVKETGIDLVLAKEYLALNNWNLEKGRSLKHTNINFNANILQAAARSIICDNHAKKSWEIS